MPRISEYSPEHSRLRRQLLLGGVGLAASACSRNEAQPPVAVAQPVQDITLANRAADDPNLLAEAMLLPGMASSATEGPLIDLLQAIGRQYSGGKITISAYPPGRVMADINSGTTDLALPFVRLYPGADAQLKHRYSTQGYGQVTFVLYSRKSHRVHPDDLRQARAKLKPGERFPYRVESALFDWGFPTIPFTDMGSALRKLEAGHTDAFLWAQEEADAELRKLGFTDIVRTSFGAYDDTLAVTRGPRGDMVDKILSQALGALHASGELQKLYSKIHLPYDPWQP